MSEARCGHPANGLLPWYLNGSLEGKEEAAVRDHLRACATCSAELAALGEFASAVSEYDPRSSGLPRRLHRQALGWSAAVAILAVGAGAYWYSRGPEGSSLSPGPRPAVLESPRSPAVTPLAPPLAATLDLGAGLQRGEGDEPALVLGERVGAVELSFVAAMTDQPLTGEIRDPAGRTLARVGPLREVDAVGRCRVTVQASLLQAPGRYALIVRAGSAAQRYPFRIGLRED